MADNASHTGISTALTIWICENLKLAKTLIPGIIVISVINFLVHFIIDTIPHGHCKNKLLELGIGFIFISPFLFYVISKQPAFVAAVLIPIGVIFGNVFDVLLVIAEGKKDRWSKTISDFNLWIHWFVREPVLMRYKYEKSEEEWKGTPVYSLKFGWYNFIPIVIAITALIFAF